MKATSSFQIFFGVFSILLILSSCGNRSSQNAPSAVLTASGFSISKEPYGEINDTTIWLYKLVNANGMEVHITNYGGAITHLIVPDRKGEAGDVALGFDSLGGYLQSGNPYFGCLVGRYANRIAKGRFILNKKTYQLPLNNNGHTLHGGVRGFDKVIWEAQEMISDSSAALRLHYLSKDGEQGFPGNLDVTVTYALHKRNDLTITYKANTDQPTPVNLTNHTYFNLSAGENPTIKDHVLMINAIRYTGVDKWLIPTGKQLKAKNGPMDFSSPKPIGRDLDKVAGGYDHNYVLRKPYKEFSLVATLYDPGSGRLMEMFTTEPGVQFYSGNFLDGSLLGKNGQTYVKHGGLCLEAQHFPDSPNQPSFPSTILRPKRAYHQLTMYRFMTK
jgi:aldose 1-epimerase